MIVRKCKAAVLKFFMWLFIRPLKKPSIGDQQKIEQLKNIFLTLPDASEMASSEAELSWNKNLNNLKNKVISGDPRAFLRWDVVRGTMFVGNAEYINVELSYLQAHKEWATRWREAIKESTHGCPPTYYRYMKSSSNLIHHAYHLARFEDETGIRVDQLQNIFEFGGGYGSMCRLVHQLGFGGKYVIFDLPHFLNLQKYYLDGLGLNVKEDNQMEEESGIFCVSEIHDLERAKVGRSNSLFIATWSLSETPIFVREPLLPYIDLCQSHLIAYQDSFGEVDNVNYFSDRPEFKSFTNVINQKITHLSANSVSRYLFCWGRQQPGSHQL